MVIPDEGSPVSARSEIDQAARAGADVPAGDRGAAEAATGEREQTYGPIGFQRYVKGDGRALILFTNRGSARAGRADE
ncbi:MAG TPA: hypothetical protein VGL54_06680 [Solirubrobacteraceae bacterium]|jgi:hypothetical protein